MGWYSKSSDLNDRKYHPYKNLEVKQIAKTNKCLSNEQLGMFKAEEKGQW